jgi:hypothetical protein
MVMEGGLDFRRWGYWIMEIHGGRVDRNLRLISYSAFWLYRTLESKPGFTLASETRGLPSPARSRQTSWHPSGYSALCSACGKSRLPTLVLYVRLGTRGGVLLPVPA